MVKKHVSETGLPKRFEVLDSWRGICAVLVMLGHFQIFMKDSLNFGQVIGNNYIFVDFFFVLSGFVIAGNYSHKLSSLKQALGFSIIRWGRVFPLHLFVLILFLGLEYARSKVEGDAMFSNQAKSLESLAANLLLIHSMGIFDYLTWNIPSWSISVEFFSYITFAVLMVVFRKKIIPVSIVLMAISPILLYVLDGRIEADITYNYGFIRCLGGFFSGVVCMAAFRKWGESCAGITKKYATFIEIFMICAVIAFAWSADIPYLSYFSPYLFFGMVFVFAQEAGTMSRILKAKPFLLMGALSYSIYMTHAFVQRVMVNGIDIVESKLQMFNWVIVGVNIEDKTDAAKYFSVSLPLALVLTVLMMSAVILFSFVTYNVIEKPAYKWVKNRVRQ
jgi:peptidoglycan/LPS O-acetylase OafA/YrhL